MTCAASLAARRVALALFATLAASPRAQPPAAALDQEVTGRVTDAGGQPLAGADVTFVPLPVQARPRAGSKGRYQVAQAAHRAQAKPPRTKTDRDGQWRVLLSPQHAALAGGSGIELALRVSAKGYATWMRAIGDGFYGARGLVAELSPDNAAGTVPRLRLQVRGLSQGSYRGYVLIERAYRARPDRSVSLRTLLPLSLTGEASFDEPARVPGEIGATMPTARAEGYRVTVFVAGLRKLQRTLIEGEHRLDLASDGFPARRVLAERGEAARLPIEATYQLGGESVVVGFDEAAVTLLGGEAPTAIRTGSGPVAVDAWDPDAALFVDADAGKAAAAIADAAAPDPQATTTLRLRVVDRRKAPLYGAAVWLEDAAAQAMLPAHRPYAISDPDGRVQLSGAPKGTHRALVRHPIAGEREVLVDSGAADPLEVVLREAAASATETQAVEPGSLLLDLGEPTSADARAEVGTVQTGKRIMRRGFDEHPRQVRLEGLAAGPVTAWVRIDDGPIHVVAGALATVEPSAPVTPLRATARAFTLDVRDHRGQPEVGAYVSLGESTPKGKRPFTASLLPVTPREPGRIELPIHLTGDLWVVVHGADGRGRDVLLQSEGATQVLAVTLPEPAPPEPAKPDKDGGK